VRALAAGAVNGSVRNRRWKFAARDTTRARARYVAVQVGGLALLVTLANWKGFPAAMGMADSQASQSSQ
jgi:hypothetical protein